MFSVSVQRAAWVGSLSGGWGNRRLTKILKTSGKSRKTTTPRMHSFQVSLAFRCPATRVYEPPFRLIGQLPCQWEGSEEGETESRGWYFPAAARRCSVNAKKKKLSIGYYLGGISQSECACPPRDPAPSWGNFWWREKFGSFRAGAVSSPEVVLSRQAWRGPWYWTMWSCGKRREITWTSWMTRWERLWVATLWRLELLGTRTGRGKPRETRLHAEQRWDPGGRGPAGLHPAAANVAGAGAVHLDLVNFLVVESVLGWFPIGEP